VFKLETFKRRHIWPLLWVISMKKRKTTRKPSNFTRDSSSVQEFWKIQLELVWVLTDLVLCITNSRTIVSFIALKQPLSVEKSLQFHQKHLQYTDNENIFASYYNLGISYRLQRSFDESIKYFKLALDWSQ
jgi:hypothetical protein